MAYEFFRLMAVASAIASSEDQPLVFALNVRGALADHWDDLLEDVSRSLTSALGDEEITVIQYDREILKIDYVELDDLPELDMDSGSGSAGAEVLKYLFSNRREDGPVTVVFFTDGHDASMSIEAAYKPWLREGDQIIWYLLEDPGSPLSDREINQLPGIKVKSW